MAGLKARVGRLLAGHRKRRGFTQQALAEHARLSIDTITKIEAGKAGIGFKTIEKLAAALDVDPAEFFTSDFANDRVRRGPLEEVTSQLSTLSDPDLAWASAILKLVLQGRHGSTPVKAEGATLRYLKAASQKHAGRVPTK